MPKSITRLLKEIGYEPVEMLDQMTASEKGKIFLNRVNNFCELWVMRTLRDSATVPRPHKTEAWITALLRQVFYYYWMNIDRDIVGDTKRDLEDLLEAMEKVKELTSICAIELFSEHEILVADEKLMINLEKLYPRNAGEKTSEYLHRLMCDMNKLPAVLIPIIEKRIENYNEKKRGRGAPIKIANAVLIQGLLRFLFTLQETKPVIAKATTVENHIHKQYDKVSDTVKRFMFIQEGLSVAGINNAISTNVDNIREENKRIDWSCETSMLKLEYALSKI